MSDGQTFGSGTAPFFSPNPASTYPVPPENWSRLHYNIPLQPSPDTGAYCNLPHTDGKQMSNRYDDCFKKAEQATGIDYRLIKALAATESGPNFDDVVEKGGLGRGIMQIDMGAHKEFSENTLLNDPCTNIMIGAQILKKGWDATHNPGDAFARYKSKQKTFDGYIQLPGAQKVWDKFIGYIRSEGVNV